MFSSISARGDLISRAAKCPKPKGEETVPYAFYVDRNLILKLRRHTPVTVCDFLCDLYGQNHLYSGIKLTPQHIIFTNFPLRTEEEFLVFRQLAECMVSSAIKKCWVKPVSRNVKNKRFAFKTWLLLIGMRGDEYADARSLLLSRLPGCSSRKSKKRRTTLRVQKRRNHA